MYFSTIFKQIIICNLTLSFHNSFRMFSESEELEVLGEKELSPVSQTTSSEADKKRKERNEKKKVFFDPNG
jgi:hypothetical protein